MKSYCLYILYVLMSIWLGIYQGKCYQRVNIIVNSIKGIPEVECKEDRVQLNVITEQPFTGNIFVKNKHYDEACVQKYRENKQKGAFFTVQIGRCGMQKLRTVDPKGMNFVIAIVISFHPQFITFVDRAYNIKCFYMEKEEMVSSKLDVSMIPTSALYDAIAMPKCKYAVKLNSLNGPEVFYANVGDTVYHVWECVGPDMGILVRNFYVKDGTGEEALTVNNEGCSADQQLRSDLTYNNSLMKAYATSLAFKYADRNTLFFTCQISLCQKRFGMCDGISPPKCAKEPVLKVKRNVMLQKNMTNLGSFPEFENENVLDVLSKEVTIFDLKGQQASSEDLEDKSEIPAVSDFEPVILSEGHYSSAQKRIICISQGVLTLAFLVIYLVALTVSGVVGPLLYHARKNLKHQQKRIQMET